MVALSRAETGITRCRAWLPSFHFDPLSFSLSAFRRRSCAGSALEYSQFHPYLHLRHLVQLFPLDGPYDAPGTGRTFSNPRTPSYPGKPVKNGPFCPPRSAAMFVVLIRTTHKAVSPPQALAYSPESITSAHAYSDGEGDVPDERQDGLSQKFCAIRAFIHPPMAHR